MENINIKLDSFEGPFDLLLVLLDRNKLEITEISINEIADQYIDYIAVSGGFDLDVASEFLIIGVTLIHMKSKKLLPKPVEEEEELTEEELARRLAKYKSYKDVSLILEKQLQYWSNSMYKLPEKLKFPPKEDIIDLNLCEISNNRLVLHQRYIESKNDNKGKMEQILEIEKVSLRDKMKQIVFALAGKFKTKFSEIFNTKTQSRVEVVTGFLAILELDKRRRVKLTQMHLFGEIDISNHENQKEGDFLDFESVYEEYS